VPDFETILRNFSGAVRRDQLAEKLRRACYDGTEVHRVDRVLPGLENAAAAAEIKRAIEAQFANTIAFDAVVEIAAPDDGEAT
jgi:anion-transporting  ArsA/GET3 family ATPase